MAMDGLQEKIRRRKCPLVVDFTAPDSYLPPCLGEGNPPARGWERYCRELMTALKGVVPGVRLSFDSFALMGEDGLAVLPGLLSQASQNGFYVLLDGPSVSAPWQAERAAEAIFGGRFPCDSLILSPYYGSDTVRPFLTAVREEKKDLFFTVRAPNRSAPELQELRTGSRTLYMAAADLVSRWGEETAGKYGYSRVGLGASATSPEGLRTLRGKYKNLFLLVDGCDYPSGSFKSCAPAFDRLGHGAVVSIGGSVTGAWRTAQSDGAGFADQALQAVARAQRNLAGYITIL